MLFAYLCAYECEGLPSSTSFYGIREGTCENYLKSRSDDLYISFERTTYLSRSNELLSRTDDLIRGRDK